MGLEQHEGESLMTASFFRWTNPLSWCFTS